MNADDDSLDLLRLDALEIDFSRRLAEPENHAVFSALIAAARRLEVRKLCVSVSDLTDIEKIMTIAPKDFSIELTVPAEFADRMPELADNENILLRFSIFDAGVIFNLAARRSRFPKEKFSVVISYSSHADAVWDHAVRAGFKPQLICSEEFTDPNADAANVRNLILNRIRKMENGQQNGSTPFIGTPCLAFASSCFVDGTGEVFPCRGCRLTEGNIFDTDLFDIQRESNVRHYFSLYREKIKAPCRTCPGFGTCAGCRGRAYRFTGDFTAADPGCAYNITQLDKIEHLPSDSPETHLPHQKPMLMISRLLTIGDNESETECTVDENSLFLRADGTLHPAALIEIAAQGMAYLDTFLHPGKFLSGVLVQADRFVYSGEPVNAGDVLRIRGRKLSELEPWHISAFEIRKFPADTFIAKGELKVCQMSSGQS